MIPAKHEKVGIVGGSRDGSTVAVVDPSQCALVLVVQVVDGQYVTDMQAQIGDRTECPAGHPYDEANTYLVMRVDGSIKQRMCRECGRERLRRRRAAAKEVMPKWVTR